MVKQNMLVNKPAYPSHIQFSRLKKHGQALVIPIAQMSGKSKTCPVRAQQTVSARARDNSACDYEFTTTQTGDAVILIRL